MNRRFLIMLTIVVAMAAPAGADRGQDAFSHGVKAERKGDYDAASNYYKQAYTLVPTNARYITAYSRTRFNAASQHLHSGQMLRNTGSLEEALKEFQRAVEIDTSSFIAQQELRRTMDMVRRQEKQRAVPPIEPHLPKLLESLSESVELAPLSGGTVTLRMTVPSDVVYKTICRLAGINLVLDPDFRPQKISVDLTDVTLREALELVGLQSKTFWKAVSPKTIFVAGDSPAKRKEIEQNVMRTFYLQNLSSPAELQEAANTVKQMLDITRVQLLQAQGALIIRGTRDQMALAEKLLTDMDRPKSEVVIEVMVMEVSRDRLRNMGTTLPTSAGFGYVGGHNSGSSASTSTSSGISGTSTGGINLTAGNFALTIPSGGSFSFLASDSNTKVLQNPEIRAMSDEKATLRIGDRVPIATGSFQPGIVGGGGVSPLVSTQFQYLDVGVNIDITPHVHSNGEVTLKMGLEISSVTGSQTIGGITQPVIGQRRIEHVTRLKDGEINLLGGILEDSETQSMSGYPWISKLPVLKYLFAQENKQRTENEILFAITPHIVRAQVTTEDNLSTIEVGTGTSTELRRKPVVPASATPVGTTKVP